jgi:hypothetical protein
MLLTACGYQVGVMEFVPSEHTRKNTLIKAVRNDVSRTPTTLVSPQSTQFDSYLQLVAGTGGVGLRLAQTLAEQTALSTT